MYGKDCHFMLKHVEDEIENMILNINCDKPCGIDNMDGRLKDCN